MGLATAVVVKIGMSPSAIADALPDIASSTRASVLQETVPSADVDASSGGGTIAANLQNKTLMKADKLEASYSDGVKSVKSVAIAPTETPPNHSNRTDRIVSWHWHDPLDKQTGQPFVKRKVSNAGANPPHIASARVPKL
jgi:hypothetical protein